MAGTHRGGEPSDAVEPTVRALIAGAGLNPSDDELAELIRVYPQFRAALDRLHAVPDARYESPALVFPAVGRYADWAENGAGPATPPLATCRAAKAAQRD